MQFGDRMDRVENSMVQGMPDINLCLESIEVWLEFKSPLEPKRDRTPLFGSNHRVSQDQMNWFKRQLDAGGRAWFVIKTDQRWLLIHGKHADQINNLTVSQLIAISDWHAIMPVPGASWFVLRDLLKNDWS